MNYLTNYYKNKCDVLLEKINYLEKTKMLFEATMSSRPAYGADSVNTESEYGNNSNDFAALMGPPRPGRFDSFGFGRKILGDDEGGFTLRDWLRHHGDNIDIMFGEMPLNYIGRINGESTVLNGVEIPLIPKGLQGKVITDLPNGDRLSDLSPEGTPLPAGVYFDSVTGQYWMITQSAPGFPSGMQFQWNWNPPPQIGGYWSQYTGGASGSPFGNAGYGGTNPSNN